MGHTPILKDTLVFNYKEAKASIIKELEDNIKSNSTFSLTLDTWTAINQDAYLGITI